MPDLLVNINQREYLVSSPQGETERIKNLAKQLDARVQELGQTIGQIGDARLLAIAGIMLLDELETKGLDHIKMAIEQEISANDEHDIDSLDARGLLPDDEEETSQELNPLIEELMTENQRLQEEKQALLQEHEDMKNWIENHIKRLEKLAS